MKTIKVLNVVVVMTGMAIIILGLNVGLGGIRTLGWQSPSDFVLVSDARVFHIQDSHVRFIGGIWFGVGATFLIGGFAMRLFRPMLVMLSAMIAVAGLFRLSGIDGGAIFSAAIAPSLVLELVGFPLLAWWLMVSGKGDAIT